MQGNDRSGGERRLPRLNFRPLVFCAIGLCLGIFVYMRVRFGGLEFSDFLFVGGLFAVALFPLSWRRAGALLLCVLLFAGAGAALSHLCSERYFSGAAEGEHEVEGTVCEFVSFNESTEVVLTGLTVDGVPCGGKLQITVLEDDVCAGDVLRFTASLRREDPPSSDDFYAFTEDIRYVANSVSAEIVGKSGNLLLRLNGALYRSLTGEIPEEEAELAYALLTGNSRVMDADILRSVRRGGIAHIFAVSGLHIGIVYAAAAFVFRPLKRWKSLPALAVAFCYTAMCGFSVSALRAAIMCTAHAVCALFHRKTDFLNAIALAAILVLLIFPAEWLSAGFRLSFGACIGLALFSAAFSRGMKRLRCPAFLADLLSSSVSVQLAIAPVLFETFGYLSVWGTLLNLVLLPLLPAFFLGILIPAFLSLIIPPAAPVFLAVPYGLTAAFLAVLANLDVTLAVAGFSIGSGGGIWLAACVALSERFRAGRYLRLSMAGFFCVLFAVFVALENIVPQGCTVKVGGNGTGMYALVRTPQESVFLVDGRISLYACQDFLTRNLTGEPTAVIVVAEDEARAINVAAFLGAPVYAMEELATGLHGSSVSFVREVAVGEMLFRFESPHKLALFAEDAVVEFDFEAQAVLGADFAVEKGTTGLKFFLRRGIIEVL